MPLYKCPSCKSKRMYASKLNESAICNLCDTPIIVPSLVIFDGESDVEELTAKRDKNLRSVAKLLESGNESEAVKRYMALFGEDEHYAKQAISAIQECGISDDIGVWDAENDPEMKERLYQDVEKTPGLFDRTAIIYVSLAVLFVVAILIKWFE